MIQLLGFLQPEISSSQVASTEYLPGCSQPKYLGKADMKVRVGADVEQLEIFPDSKTVQEHNLGKPRSALSCWKSPTKLRLVELIP